MLYQMQRRRSRSIAGKVARAYGAEDFVRVVREMKATPQVTRNDNERNRDSGLQATLRAGYAVCMSRR
jgi:hypothetical protein